jgi:hypothetical protein
MSEQHCVGGALYRPPWQGLRWHCPQRLFLEATTLLPGAAERIPPPPHTLTQQRLRVLVRKLDSFGPHETSYRRQPLQHVLAEEHRCLRIRTAAPGLVGDGLSEGRAPELVLLVFNRPVHSRTSHLCLAKRRLRAVIRSPRSKYPGRVSCSVKISKIQQIHARAPKSG